MVREEGERERSLGNKGVLKANKGVLKRNKGVLKENKGGPGKQ